MTDYRGGASDMNRIKIIERRREEERKRNEEQIEKIKEESKAKVVHINEKFSSNTGSFAEKLVLQTIGLVTGEEFKKKRERLEAEEKQRIDKEVIEKKKAAERKKARLEKNRLSFDVEEPEDEEETTEKPKTTKSENTEQKQESNLAEENVKLEDQETSKSEKVESIIKESKKRSFGKDPNVNTSFLPDTEREERERQERERFAQEFYKEQEKFKAETISISFSYYDGSGRRKTLTVKKGTTIGQFLELARKEFKELRGVSAENLMFIKEDFIIPHQYTFLELIESKAKVKYGFLFDFDVHEDIRTLHDASVEKSESHAPKVVERNWYNKHKHVFPASKWLVYPNDFPGNSDKK